MGEWLAKIGASWGTAFALAAAVILAADGSRRLLKFFRRHRVNREELHIEEFRRTVDELLAELESAATAIESRIGAQLDRLADAEREIDEKLRRLSLIDVAAKTGGVSVDQTAPAVTSASPPSQTAALLSGTQADRAIPAASARRTVETRSRRLGRFAKSSPDDAQIAQFEQMRRMSADGTSPAAIAEKLRVPLGEVETYLSLRDFAR